MKIEESKVAWESAAHGWARWEPTVAEWMQPATERMLDRAGVKTGSRVIDLACGAGSQSLAAARRCGPTGEVIATDISETMLRYLQEAAAKAHLANVRTIASAAERLQLPAGTCDAAICQLGLMLFQEPAGALAAVHTVLRSGGRFAAVVFSRPEHSPMLAQPMQILRRHANKPAPVAAGPGLFSLGPPGVLEHLMLQAGFEDVGVETMDLELHMRSADEALEMMREAFGAYRAVVADQPETTRASAWAEVAQCLQSFTEGGVFRAHTQVLIGSGTHA